MEGILGKIKVSWGEFHHQLNNASMDWRGIEYKECSEDWRHRDRLIWATLPVAATVAGVIVGVAYGYIPDDKLWIRLCLLLIGVFLTLVMLISLIKHRLFQEGSREQIRSLQIRLNIRNWDRNPRIHPPFYFRLSGIIPGKKFDAALTRWAKRRSGYKWMLRGTLFVMAIMMALATLTVVQLILN
jgi:hypothetical protein